MDIKKFNRSLTFCFPPMQRREDPDRVSADQVNDISLIFWDYIKTDASIVMKLKIIYLYKNK